MEARVVISVLFRHWIIIFFAVVIGLLGGFLYSLLQRETYVASVMLYLKPRIDLESQEKDYFAQLRSRDFTETLVALLSSEDSQKEAGVAFKPRKVAPQLIKISTVALSESEVKEDIEEARVFSENKLNKLAGEADPFLSLTKVSKEPFISKTSTKPILSTIVGLFLGFTLGAVFVALKVYFFPTRK